MQTVPLQKYAGTRSLAPYCLLYQTITFPDSPACLSAHLLHSRASAAVALTEAPVEAAAASAPGRAVGLAVVRGGVCVGRRLSVRGQRGRRGGVVRGVAEPLVVGCLGVYGGPGGVAVLPAKPPLLVLLEALLLVLVLVALLLVLLLVALLLLRGLRGGLGESRGARGGLGGDEGLSLEHLDEVGELGVRLALADVALRRGGVGRSEKREESEWRGWGRWRAMAGDGGGAPWA